MLTCIACSTSKQLNGSYKEHEDEVGTPSGKGSIKSLTAHIKEMALKASGAYKSCKPCSGPSRSQEYAESEATSASGRFYGSYRRAESCNSTPRQWGKDMESILKGVSSGEGTHVSISGRVGAVVLMEDDEPKEWIAQVEPGVLITFVSLPRGGNNLKKIQFSREMFNKWEAQRWWGQNYERIMELYNVQRSLQQAEPSRSANESSKVASAETSPATPPLNEKRLPRNVHHPITRASSNSLDPHTASQELIGQGMAQNFSSPHATVTEATSASASARSSSSHEPNYSGDLAVSIANDAENEWVEEDEPGVYITLRALPGGICELRRVRFSRERFGEMHARLWWEENRARIQEQYLR